MTPIIRFLKSSLKNSISEYNPTVLLFHIQFRARVVIILFLDMFLPSASTVLIQQPYRYHAGLVQRRCNVSQPCPTINLIDLDGA